MTCLTIRTAAPTSEPHYGHQHALARVVAAIGSDALGPSLVTYLNALCGADHFAAFHIYDDAVTEVAACCVEPEHTRRQRGLVERYLGQEAWRQDPAMLLALRHASVPTPTMIHADLTHRDYACLRSNLYPRISDRVLLCGNAGGRGFGLSVLRQRPHGQFGSGAIDTLFGTAELIVALLGQHAQRGGAADARDAIRSLAVIEQSIATQTSLPRRESEVCARILRGLSSAGIAVDLGIGEETVKTYRKRVFQRLGIGSERELLVWYLHIWSGRRH